MYKYKWVFTFLILSGVFGCKEDEKTKAPESPGIVQDSTAWIIEKTLEAHGSHLLNKSITEFDFRNDHFKVTRKGGSYSYERTRTDSTGNQLHDVLTNAVFYRERNGQRVELTEKDSSSFSSSVNSVVYFALLPYFLKDRAVRKTRLENVMLKGKPYFKIAVHFDQEGGGKDFEDEYVYWIHREHFTLDYLAYNYQDGAGPETRGARFREAYGVRTVNGVRFADYRNFKPKAATELNIETFDQLFENEGMELLSLVELSNLKVHLLE